MPNKAMCESTSKARTNRENISNDLGGRWHREQQSMTEGWQFGTPKPLGLKTYDLPMLSQRTHRPSRLTED